MICLAQINKAGLEEIFASCDYFSASLLVLSERLQQFLSALEELQVEIDERPNGKSWTWVFASWWWWPDQGRERHHLNAGELF